MSQEGRHAIDKPGAEEVTASSIKVPLSNARHLSEKIRLGMTLAKIHGAILGRPRRDDVDPHEVEQLRDQERLSWNKIAARLDTGRGTVIRAYGMAKRAAAPSQKGSAGVL